MASKTITLKAVGDVCFTDVDVDPFTKIGDGLDADLLFCNLECCLTTHDDGTRKNVLLKAKPETADHLAAHGFNLVCLANNHSLDFGPAGLADTLAALDARSLAYFGAGRDAAAAGRVFRVESEGIRIAVLSAADASGGRSDGPTIACDSASSLRDRIGRVRDADVIVVSYHAGIELDTLPSPFLVRSYRGFIDAGADIVLGHHPHVLQPIEVYRDRLIAYSLGNFVFDNRRYGDKMMLASRSMILGVRITMESDRAIAVDYDRIPVKIGEDRLPHRLDDGEAEEFDRHMTRLGASLRGVRADAVDVRRMDDLASEFHKKSLKTVVRYGARHIRDFSFREIVVGIGLVMRHALSRLGKK